MNTDKIKWVISDIDGVLTNGQIYLEENGNEAKHIYVRDLDAVGAGRIAGLEFALITGEDNQLAKTIAHRFGILHLSAGAKDKLLALQILCDREKLARENVCYIGDSDRDAPAIAWAGIGVSPADGSESAMSAAVYLTKCIGGRGVLAETVSMILTQRERAQS